MARSIETYAPASANKSPEEMIQPTLGGGVEVSIAWKERVISTHHFHHKGKISLGTHPSCDITIPLIHSFIDKMEILKIDSSIEVLVSPGLKAQIIEEGSVRDLNEQNYYLQQKQVVKIQLNDSISLLIRPSQTTMRPRLIPFIDISSNGFLSFAFAVTLALVMALFVKLNPSPKNIFMSEEIYPISLIIQNPERLAEIIRPPVKVKPPKIKPPKAQKVPPRKKPPALISKAKSNKPSENGRPAKSLAKNSNKTPNKSGSLQKGKSVKVAVRYQGAQAKSTNLKDSKLFAAISSFGQRKDLDKGYSGDGELAGLADKATGSAGEIEDRPGDRMGSRFKEASSSKSGQSNVGVEGIKGGTGLGPGFDNRSIGDHQSVSIVPDGQGAVFGGRIDREGIRQVFFDNAKAIRSCYERVLNQNTQLGGKVMLNFDIGAGGRVVGRPSVNRPMSTLLHSQLSECLTGRLQTWQFPDPPAGQVVNVLYPLAFSSK